jgi:hypothetical protein
MAKRSLVSSVPELSNREFRALVIDACRRERRVSALFADSRDGEGGGDLVELYAVLAEEDTASLLLARTRIEADVFESLTPDCPQVHLFEREIAEQYGCVPRGHPWLKPVRFHAPYRRPVSGVATATAPVVGVMDYYRVEGDEVHEVAVGPGARGDHRAGPLSLPVPRGERVPPRDLARLPAPGHRAPPRRRPDSQDRALHGDARRRHDARSRDRLLPRRGSPRPDPRPGEGPVHPGIALELERLANHVGDLGALAGDVGYLPTASFCGRIRGDYLNMSALLCGNRFGRDLTRVGGVRFDIDEAMKESLLKRLEAAERDTASAVNLLWDSSSVMSRFEDAGSISEEVAREIGLVGPAARASGLGRDVRTDFPKGAYRYSHVPMCTWSTGDVFARAYVRWLEIQNSIRFIREELQELPEGALQVSVPA